VESLPPFLTCRQACAGGSQRQVRRTPPPRKVVHRGSKSSMRWRSRIGSRLLGTSLLSSTTHCRPSGRNGPWQNPPLRPTPHLKPPTSPGIVGVRPNGHKFLWVFFIFFIFLFLFLGGGGLVPWGYSSSNGYDQRWSSCFRLLKPNVSALVGPAPAVTIPECTRYLCVSGPVDNTR